MPPASARVERNRDIPDFDETKVDFNTRLLNAHNRVRKYHGAPPVAIDWALAKGAQSWAKDMYRQKHSNPSPQENRGEGVGENRFNLDYFSDGLSALCKEADLITSTWYSEIVKPGYDFKNHDNP
jgi:hypothetical protein